MSVKRMSPIPAERVEAYEKLVATPPEWNAWMQTIRTLRSTAICSRCCMVRQAGWLACQRMSGEVPVQVQDSAVRGIRSRNERVCCRSRCNAEQAEGAATVFRDELRVGQDTEGEAHREESVRA